MRDRTHTMLPLTNHPPWLTVCWIYLHGDLKAEAYLDNAEHLQPRGEPFDWIGMHYMLYHVSDIGVAIRSAWAQVRPGPEASY